MVTGPETVMEASGPATAMAPLASCGSPKVSGTSMVTSPRVMVFMVTSSEPPSSPPQAARDSTIIAAQSSARIFLIFM